MRARVLRKGQSEVIGGLIVLTLLFMFAIPIILNSYYASIQAAQEAKTSLAETRLSLNEKLAVSPVDPTNELAQRAGWIPGVWINNTGTVAVTLDKLYLVDQSNNTIYAEYDIRWARPGITPEIEDLVIDPLSPEAYTPQAGDLITLQPGQSLLIVFNESILPVAPNLYVLVESTSGILHPIAGGGAPQTLYPGRPGGQAPVGAWRGIFAPQSGFSLRGYDELMKSGTAYAWRPPLYVYPDRDDDRRYEPEDLDYRQSFIYEDPDYPGLYYLDIILDEWTYLRVRTPSGWTGTWVSPGDRIVIKGYVGTYDAGNGDYGTYFNGYAFEVYIYSGSYAWWHVGPYAPINLGSRGIMESDFDGNGVQELTFYSYLNGPTYSSTYNVDADNDGDIYKDALVWTYMVARDISGVDYIKVTVKLNYYWTTVFSTYYGGCPDWNYRRLKVFAIVIWKYDPSTGEWHVHQYQNYGYTSEKPVQFQETAVFPVEHNGTYRVGLLIYDNYRDWDFDFWCHTDFTMSLEHVIVEYGVYNPLFQESPPLYIVAIPDSSLIGEIGEQDYAQAHNITDLDEAKIRAQADFLEKLEAELDYAGVSGYTVITEQNTLCNLLFGDNPPKYAIIIWLQGNVTIEDVTRGYCTISNAEMGDYMERYHWVLVWPFGEPLGDRYSISNYDIWASITDPGEYEANITEWGMKIWKEAYAYYLFNTVKFKYLVREPTHLILNATFYNGTDGYYGTTGFWLERDYNTRTIEEGVLVLNPVHIDWDLSGDGAMPETVVQQVVYSSLMAWAIMTYGG